MPTTSRDAAWHRKLKLTTKTAEARPRPGDAGPFVVLTELAARDGSGDLAFCSAEASDSNSFGTGANNSFLIDLTQAWAPDGDGEFAIVCPICKSAHWAIPFVNFLLETDYNFEDGIIMIAADRFLAESTINLRAKAAREEGMRTEVGRPKAVAR